MNRSHFFRFFYISCVVVVMSYLATKLKLGKEKELFQARNIERNLIEELATVHAETEFLKEQLEDVRSQIAQAKCQISMIKICSTSEKCKIDALMANLELHRAGFQKIFDTERHLFDLRMKEINDKEAAEEEMQRQKEIQVAEMREREAKEAATVEIECKVLEKECGILKKRNNAIMLKLRRKLLETEHTRRELTKRNASVAVDDSTPNKNN